MTIKKIFIEEQIQDHPQALKILGSLSKTPVQVIRKVEDVFGRARKPYLQKRTDLNLFIGRKEGNLVKEAPDAYGLDGDPHFYFIHSYNCIYECEYCYLQGYFKSPDLVLFVNHDEIMTEMASVLDRYGPDQRVWFHAGEFSDSLALTAISQEWPLYWPFFEKYPNAWLELRTKAVNIRPILELGSLPNVVITFSLSPEGVAEQLDRNTPPLAARLKAIRKLAEAGFMIGIHFDPIVYSEHLLEDYQQLVDHLLENVPESQIVYISIGVVRFSRDVYHEFKKNYPSSPLLGEEMVVSFDQKIRYQRPHRLYILKNVQNICLEKGISAHKVYLCMEDEIAE